MVSVWTIAVDFFSTNGCVSICFNIVFSNTGSVSHILAAKGHEIFDEGAFFSD